MIWCFIHFSRSSSLSEREQGNCCSIATVMLASSAVASLAAMLFFVSPGFRTDDNTTFACSFQSQKLKQKIKQGLFTSGAMYASIAPSFTISNHYNSTHIKLVFNELVSYLSEDGSVTILSQLRNRKLLCRKCRILFYSAALVIEATACKAFS